MGQTFYFAINHEDIHFACCNDFEELKRVFPCDNYMKKRAISRSPIPREYNRSYVSYDIDFINDEGSAITYTKGHYTVIRVNPTLPPPNHYYQEIVIQDTRNTDIKYEHKILHFDGEHIMDGFWKELNKLLNKLNEMSSEREVIMCLENEKSINMMKYLRHIFDDIINETK